MLSVREQVHKEDINRILAEIERKSNEIQGALKRINIREDISHQELMEMIVKTIEEITGQKMQGFGEYLSFEYRIPIEINFRPLKLDQLRSLIEDWRNSLELVSVRLDRLYTLHFRNSSFRAILVHQKEIIDQYFQTLSPKYNRLKSCDVFPLLMDILSDHYLYASHETNQTFFDQVGSFDLFTTVVNHFLADSKRIRLPDWDPQYLHRYEFDKLMEFWECTWPQLQLLHEPRKNHSDQESQTQSPIFLQASSQTSKIYEDFLSFLSQMLVEMTKLLEIQKKPHILVAAQRVYGLLLQQKIALQPSQNSNSSEIQNSLQTNHNHTSNPILKPELNLNPNAHLQPIPPSHQIYLRPAPIFPYDQSPYSSPISAMGQMYKYPTNHPYSPSYQLPADHFAYHPNVLIPSQSAIHPQPHSNDPIPPPPPEQDFQILHQDRSKIFQHFLTPEKTDGNPKLSRNELQRKYTLYSLNQNMGLRQLSNYLTDIGLLRGSDNQILYTLVDQVPVKNICKITFQEFVKIVKLASKYMPSEKSSSKQPPPSKQKKAPVYRVGLLKEQYAKSKSPMAK